MVLESLSFQRCPVRSRNLVVLIVVEVCHVIRAVCRASRVSCAQNRFSAWVDKTISRVFLLRRYFVPGILPFSKCWSFLLIRISLKTAPLCHRRGIHYHPSLAALRAVRRASGLCVCRVQCDAVCLNTKKKKQAAGPTTSMGATSSWWTRVRAPSCVLFTFFSFAFFFFSFSFPHSFFF